MDSYAAKLEPYQNAPLQHRYIANYMSGMPAYGALLGTTHLNPAMAPSVYGYPMREPFQSERDFFSGNKNVAGMMTEDNAVILNPYSPRSPQEKAAVARLEAGRLYMKEKGYKFDFELTPQQKQYFAGTIYGNPGNEQYAKASLISRGLVNDPSAQDITPEQRSWVDRISQEMRSRDVRPFAPGEYVQNPNNSWSSEISATIPHPTKPGKWTNVPSVWLVNGKPMRLTEDQAAAAARQSGLDWPEFPSAEVADRAAGAREDDWQRVGPQGAAQIPPLWNKAP